jgi:hypothetical protein
MFNPVRFTICERVSVILQHGCGSRAFRIEYWALEEAKLQRMRPRRSLEGRVALITGAGGGIGTAIARR